MIQTHYNPEHPMNLDNLSKIMRDIDKRDILTLLTLCHVIEDVAKNDPYGAFGAISNILNLFGVITKKTGSVEKIALNKTVQILYWKTTKSNYIPCFDVQNGNFVVFYNNQLFRFPVINPNHDSTYKELSTLTKTPIKTALNWLRKFVKYAKQNPNLILFPYCSRLPFAPLPVDYSSSYIKPCRTLLYKTGIQMIFHPLTVAIGDRWVRVQTPKFGGGGRCTTPGLVAIAVCELLTGKPSPTPIPDDMEFLNTIETITTFATDQILAFINNGGKALEIDDDEDDEGDNDDDEVSEVNYIPRRLI